MNDEQIALWRSVCARLSVAVIAPFEMTLSDGRRMVATAHLPQFGFAKGMVADSEWSKIEPFAKQLVADGYGYSAITISGDENQMIEVLQDWKWNGELASEPIWLRN